MKTLAIPRPILIRLIDRYSLDDLTALKETAIKYEALEVAEVIEDQIGDVLRNTCQYRPELLPFDWGADNMHDRVITAGGDSVYQLRMTDYKQWPIYGSVSIRNSSQTEWLHWSMDGRCADNNRFDLRLRPA